MRPSGRTAKLEPMLSRRRFLVSRHAPVVVRVEHQLRPAFFVLPVQFLIAKIVAYLQVAAEALYREDDQARPRTVEVQIAFGTVRALGAEHFVVAVDNLAAIVNEVQAVVRLVPARERVVRSQNDP